MNNIQREVWDAEVAKVLPEWKKTGLLDGLDDYRSEQIAMILENQRLMKEVTSEDHDNKIFREMSIPLVAKIFRDFVGFDIISVQTMLGPVGKVYYYKFKYEEITKQWEKSLLTEEIAAKTRKLKCCPPQESKDIDLIASEVRGELSREIFNDLRNNSGTIMNAEDWNIDSINGKIFHMSDIIHRKTLVDGNYWIVANNENAKLISSSFQSKDIEVKIEEMDKSKSTEVTSIGKISTRYTLIVDPLFPTDKILMGTYFPFNSGYFYCPYVALTMTPRICSPDFCPRIGLLTRYGKKLTREGAKYYGVISLNKEEIKDGSET